MIEKPAPNSSPSLKHELRTPLNHIIGYCEMLTEEAQDRGLEKLLPDLERIHTAGRRLLAVINDICDPEKLPAFLLSPALIDHDVRTPLNQIIGYAEMLQEEARESGQPGLVADLERIHSAARELLRRVVTHFTPQETPVAEAPSAPPEGATTIFRRQSAKPSAALRPAPKGRLLVADDDEGNRLMLRRRLERLGHFVALAENGQDALNQLRAGTFDLLLLDVQMPELTGYEVLELMKNDEALADVPVIVLSASDDIARVARCVEMGAEDYLPKPFDPVLLRARIHACLEKKLLRESERRAFAALQKSQQALSAELAEASAYVQSLLPVPLRQEGVVVDWRFLPSTQLGGDAFGYHWLDGNRLALFLLDVCGHGVGAALLSVSVMNVLRNQSMPGVDFADPPAVLAALNLAFPMERQNNMFFTIWYGVLNTDTCDITFACGGHPPAVSVEPGADGPACLRVPGAIIGGFPEARYAVGRRPLPRGSRLYVFSDGVYELARPDGSSVQLEEFVHLLGQPSVGGKLEEVMRWAADIRADQGFDDDVSIIEITLPQLPQ
jgi:sigma-B regulation protein RsbU (phosphoserine phosphatase)